jgi:hypothetical protein
MRNINLFCGYFSTFVGVFCLIKGLNELALINSGAGLFNFGVYYLTKKNK